MMNHVLQHVSQRLSTLSSTLRFVAYQVLKRSLDAEIYFARSVGVAILAIALLMLFLSGLVPLGSVDAPSNERNPSLYVDAAVKITALYHAAAAFQSYTSYAAFNSASLLLNTFASSSLAAFGLWYIMFGSGGHISRRTGRDKRTSGWPFKNQQANKRS